MEIIIAVILTFIITSVLAWLIFRSEIKKIKGRHSRMLNDLLLESRAALHFNRLIMQTIDLGVLYYDSNNQLILSNEASGNMLEEIPDDFHKFLNRYGKENNLSSNLVLGKDEADAIFSLKNLQVYLKVHVVQESEGPSHIVLLRDVSRQFREEQQRKEYVSNVSHELRTPLTTIQTYSESLIDWGINEKKPAQLHKDVSKIYEESLRMEKLIDDLNLLSSVDENSIHRQMRVEAVDLPRVMKDLTESMQMQAKDNQKTLTCMVVSHMPNIYVDRSQLERVVSNLISNAFKYGRENGTVQVYVGYITDEVYIKVRDDGMGIASDHHKHIFERFYRVDDSRARKLGGRGLGLAIVKELVELNQGTISLKSTLGEYSEFTVMLPGGQKVLRQTLVELVRDGQASNKITEAAAQDLEQLALSMGIVAKWKSLQPSEVNRIHIEIERLTAEASKR